MSRTMAVVGGGVTGLACALRLTEISREKGAGWDVALLESGKRPGGVIATEKEKGCILESGPDALFTEKPWGVEFLKKLGLESEIIGTRAGFRKSFVFRRGRLHPVPEGFYLIAPSQLLPLMTTPLFSLKGKLRALGDLFLPAGPSNGDESLESFVTRRLGREVHDRLAQPMVAGIYSSRSSELSLKATFPRFLELERKYGSVIRGLMSAKRVPSRGPRYSLFVSLSGGMGSMAEKAAASLPAGTFKPGHAVKSLRYAGGKGSALEIAGDGFRLTADAVCLALPAYASADVIRGLSADLAGELDGIPYHTGATVNLLYGRRDVPHSLDGFGYVVPETEKLSVTGCTFSSVKFPGRAPEGTALLRAFAGGRDESGFFSLSDDDLAVAARREVEKALGIRAEPLLVRVARHPKSLPQYRVGHLEKAARIEERLREFPRLALAGNAYYGVGIPDCVRAGEQAAERMAEAVSRLFP